MADEQAIKKVIDDNSLTGTDAEIAAALNAVNQPGDVPGREIKVYLNRSDAWADILIAASVESKLALRIREVLADSESTLTMTDDDVTGGMDAAVTAGLISGEQRTAILEMADDRQSLAQIHGLGRVKVGHVIAARDIN